MKPISSNPAFILLLCALTCFSSCRKKPVNEVKINDFASLSKEFKTPSAEYTTAPFFVWNYKITKEEIDNYLSEFKKQGSSQVFIHPRPGLVTEYLSDEWFELFKYAVEKGKELGMKIWIYDENSYPSGFAGGHVPDIMPESFNQGQGLKMTRCDILPDTAGSYYLCLKEEDGKFSDITTRLGEEKGKTGKYLLFYKTFQGKSDWYGGFSYVDLLYPGVTQKFIEVTMTGYEKNLGTEFGNTIPGVFTDEPQISSPGGIRWTPDLFAVFQEKWNYDLRLQLPSLYEEVGEWKRVRHNYTQTLLQLFIDRWAKPYFKYCEEKGLKFTGHYWEHEWPNMENGGDNMAMYAWHQLPAIDMLFNQWNDTTPRGQFGNVRSVKELASAANQTGRQRKLSETYGGAGWELTFTDMKRLGDWEYALGVNLMNQHLSHITLAGARKYDYPPTFTYHEPWWNNYKFINDHYARLSLALSSGEQINDILILEPTTSTWLFDSYVNKNPKQQEIGQAFQSFITKLEKSQIEYDLGSENIIRDLGSVKNRKFIVGKRSYSIVVIPPMTENLDLATFNLLSRFVSDGGKLVTFSVPSLIDGAEDSRIKELFKEDGEISYEKNPDEGTIRKYFSNGEISFTEVSGGDLYHQRRVLSDGQLVFLANSSLEEPAGGSVRIKGAGAIEFNTLTGEMTGYPVSSDGDQIKLSFDLPPAGSLLLFISSLKPDGFSAGIKPALNDTIPASGPMKITCDNENAMTIEFCDIKIGNEIYLNLNTYDAADKVFKYHGFKNGNPWNTSVQYKTNIVDRDTFGVKTGFTATYHFDVKDKFDYTSIKAIVERPYLWKVELNAAELKPEEGKWWLDREFGVFQIGRLVRQGDNTLSITASPMKVHAEIEPVYLVGDFSVVPADKGWKISSPVKSLTTGSWKEQGLPFYSWGVTYSKEYDINEPAGHYIVSLPDWNGTVAEVKVNGNPSPPIAFPPFQSDISEQIKPGKNVIEVKVIGSLKNLLGPHFNNPAPGLASPWNWRNVKSYPAGKDYQMIDYGLMQEFRVMNTN
jgi:hypothetical protein